MSKSPRPWCKHYAGMNQKTSCEAGVVFATLPHYGTSEFFAACPCFGPRGGCDRAVYRTAAELAAAEEELGRRWEAIGRAREAIVNSLGGPWKRGTAGSTGTIDCPVCGGAGTLRFSRSGYNGHVHAHCRTEECVQWME